MASSILNVAVLLKSCVQLNLLTLWRFRDSSIVTAFIVIFQIHSSCSIEKRENMTLTISGKKKFTDENCKMVQTFDHSHDSSDDILICFFLTS